MKKGPNFRMERLYLSLGKELIAGVDEVGCGALAGPVLAGAVVLPVGARLPLVRDSKELTPTKRDIAYEQIIKVAKTWSVAEASVEEITALGIRQATYLAMQRAIEALAYEIDHVLVDAWTIPNIPMSQTGIIKGDRRVKSIAAASILAKVTRDRYMVQLGEKYPAYGFSVHKGYGTKGHVQALRAHGPCPAHRPTFSWGKEDA